METKKETKTYRFETEVIEHAEKNPMIPSFPEWACDRYRKEFMEVQTLAAKMQTYYDMADACKERLKVLKEEISKGADLSNLKPNELRWIKNEAPGRIKRATFEGVYKCFVNTFDRKDINRRQFKLLVARFEAEKNSGIDPKKSKNRA